MTLHHGDCLDVMAGMDPESVDAIVTDPPYGLEFMGKEWDKLDAGLPQENVWKGRRGKGGSSIGTDDSKPQSRHHVGYGGGQQGFKRCATCGKRAFSGSPCQCAEPVWVMEYAQTAPSSAIRMGRWHQQWAEAAYRVAKPSAYLLAFGGTRTVHRMTCAIEDAGWIVRDMLVWAYASGFPKSKASLKPAWEPIVMARKPGPLRMLAIDECRIPSGEAWEGGPTRDLGGVTYGGPLNEQRSDSHPAGRWPANVILTDPIFDGGVEGVVGGGETSSGSRTGQYDGSASWSGEYGPVGRDIDGDSGTYSRFFLITKAGRTDREPVLGGLPLRDAGAYEGNADVGGSRKIGARPDLPVSQRANVHPTVKPTDLMRHLVRLVTPATVTVLQCEHGHEHLPTVRANVPAPDDAALLLDGMSGVGRSPGEGLPDVRSDVLEAGPDVGSAVLLPSVRERGGAARSDPLRGVRHAVPPRQAEQPLLFADMLGEGERKEATGPDAKPGGLHPGVEPGTSERDEVGLRDAASASDVGRPASAPAVGGSGRPHQRGQGRQPAREPASAGEAGPRLPAEAAAEADRVSSLSRDAAAVGPCPECGAPLVARTRPGVVLDPFAGSGSTLIAAEMEGFGWVGIEREAEYVAIAEARLNGVQRGLGLEAS